MGVPTVIEGEAEFVLAEKLVEKLPTQGSDGVQAVVFPVVLEKDRRERLRCGARQYLRALGGIVLAVLGAAMDDVSELASGRGLVAVADEADFAGGVGEPVRADRRIGDDAVVRAYAARPLIGLFVRGFQLRRHLGRPAEVQQKAGCSGKRVVKDEIPVRGELVPLERPARRVDEPCAGIEARARVGGSRGQRGGQRRGGAGEHEIASVHGQIRRNAKGCGWACQPAGRLLTVTSAAGSLRREIRTRPPCGRSKSEAAWWGSCRPPPADCDSEWSRSCRIRGEGANRRAVRAARAWRRTWSRN